MKTGRLLGHCQSNQIKQNKHGRDEAAHLLVNKALTLIAAQSVINI